MKADPMAAYFPVFMVSWIALGIGSWLWIWSRPSAEQKRVWHRRIAIAAGVVFGAFIVYTLLESKQPFALLIFIPVLLLITWLNLRFTTFCDSCNRMIYNQFWWRSVRFCPHCGASLTKPI